MSFSSPPQQISQSQTARHDSDDASSSSQRGHRLPLSTPNDGHIQAFMPSPHSSMSNDHHKIRSSSNDTASGRQDFDIARFARLSRSPRSSTRDANDFIQRKLIPKSEWSQDNLPASIPAATARLRIKPGTPSMDQVLSSSSSGLSKRPATDDRREGLRSHRSVASVDSRYRKQWSALEPRRQNRDAAHSTIGRHGNNNDLSEALPDEKTRSRGKNRSQVESESSDGDRLDDFANPDSQLLPQDSLHLRGKQRWSGVVLQPEFSPISQEQLAAEVKGIYAGLVMVEAKCINVQSASQRQDELTTEQWQALVALHRTLLYDHHDFLMVTQHPSANPALLGLATKYSMPARGGILSHHMAPQSPAARLASIKHAIRYLTKASPPGTNKRLPRNTTELTISGSLQGNDVSAFPDTGASANFISEQYARRHGFPIDDSAKSHVTVGNGARVGIVGTTTLPFNFAKESKSHQLTFNVLRKSLHDVILGSPFLRVTETLTRFTARIGRKVRDSVSDSFYRLCMLDTNMYVHGLVNGMPVSAVPDTGAEVSVMSASFARENGFRVDSAEWHRIPFGFADGSTAVALGVIEEATWHYRQDNEAHSTDFYVLEDLPVDVVLGNDFLWQTDAFVEHEDDLWHVETTTAKDEFTLNLIRVLGSCADAQSSMHAGTNASANTALESRRTEALAAYRQAKQDAHDQNLTGDEKTRYLESFLTAWQRLWETNPGHVAPAGSATLVPPSNNTSASPSQINGAQNHNKPQSQAPDPGINPSLPPNKSRVNWLKRAVGWRSRRCVVAG